MYRKDFFKFAKKACNGTLDSMDVAPTFTKQQADDFYSSRYSTSIEIDQANLSWFPSVEEPQVPYDTSSVSPGMLKTIFKSKSATSAPGEDGVMYGVLAKMPSTHYFLATLYNKLDRCGEAPDIWANIIVTLAYKGGDTGETSNFRMIALTSCLAKPYHIIKAERLSKFMVDNKYIDPSVQKGFMANINGCVEHTTLLQEIIQHSRKNNKTLHISSYDLQDAFGSISHDLIPITLKHYIQRFLRMSSATSLTCTVNSMGKL